MRSLVRLGLALSCASACSPGPSSTDAVPQAAAPAERAAARTAPPERVSARFEVRFDEATPEQELAVVYHGATLVRWIMSAAPTPAFPSGARLLEYRFGERAFHVPAGSSGSLELLGEELCVELRRMALRGALLPWDPSAWARDGVRATRAIEPVERGTFARAALGELRAVLDGAGRPVQIGVHAPDGSEQERLVVLAWREDSGWFWPERAELRIGGERVWDERLLSLSTRARYLDVFFAPSDRAEELCPPAEGLPGAPRPIAFQSPFELKVALPVAGDLAAARERERALRAEIGTELARSSLELDPVARFELDPSLAPVAVVVRLAGEPAAAPPGWERAAEGTGWALDLAPGAEPKPVDLERLRQLHGPGATLEIRLEECSPRPRLSVR